MNKGDTIKHLKHLVTANIIDGEVIGEMYSCLDSLKDTLETVRQILHKEHGFNAMDEVIDRIDRVI